MTAADTPSRPANGQSTPYERIGGETTIRRLADRFYEIMDADPRAARIRAMHGQDLTDIRQLLFEFLSGWLGGPPLYFTRPEHRCIMSAHRRYPIGAAEHDEWMMCMRQAMQDCGIPPDLYAALDVAFSRMATAFRSN